MSTESEFIRALAHTLKLFPAFPSCCTDEREAAELVLRVSFEERCPRCARPATLVDVRSARCRAGHTFSVTAQTPIARTKIRLSHWLTAVWHLHVDRETISARAFSARYRLRHATAWALLHRVRRAFVHATPRLRGATAPIARRNGARTARTVNASRDEGTLVLIDDVTTQSPGQPGAREAPLVIGRLRAWLTTFFCGVSDRHLHLYLAEYAARFGRRRPPLPVSD